MRKELLRATVSAFCVLTMVPTMVLAQPYPTPYAAPQPPLSSRPLPPPDSAMPPPPDEAMAAPDEGPQPGQAQEAAAPLAPGQLDQLLAPVALYPDDLLSQVLMASTYPLDVVQASRWLQDRQNAALRGDQLAAALEQQPWDPSVKSLVPFPQVLDMLNQRLDWTQQVGQAFLAQQDDVMGSVQRLRQEAQNHGALTNTPQQTIANDGGAIEIMPANPETVYVPSYDPRVVYGDWPYPDYPPTYFAPGPGYIVSPLYAGIGFGAGIAVVGALWGWHHWDWHSHRIAIDAGRYNRLNFGHPPIRNGFWAHDAARDHGFAGRALAPRGFAGRAAPGRAAPFRGGPNFAGNHAAFAHGGPSPDRAARAEHFAAPQARAEHFAQPHSAGRPAGQPQHFGRPEGQQSRNFARPGAPQHNFAQAQHPQAAQAHAAFARAEHAQAPHQQAAARPAGGGHQQEHHDDHGGGHDDHHH